MRAGITRPLGRALRYGAAVACVCLVVAVISGVGGYLAGRQPGGAPRDPSASALQRVLGARARFAEAATPATTDLTFAARMLTIAAQQAPAVQLTPEPPPTAIPPLDSQTPLATASRTEAAQAAVPRDTATPTPTPRATATPSATPTVTPTPRPVRTAGGRLEPGDRVHAVVTYYYCEEVAGEYSGDGGGFCDVMADGTVVHAGAAACAAAYLGQRFRIEGDPTGREYVCADTGSGVGASRRDIWFATNAEGARWQEAVGAGAVIEILP